MSKVFCTLSCRQAHIPAEISAIFLKILPQKEKGDEQNDRAEYCQCREKRANNRAWGDSN